MGCVLCKSDTWDTYYDETGKCEYYVCWDCWSTLPKWLPNKEQAWKLIKMRGDKIRETL